MASTCPKYIRHVSAARAAVSPSRGQSDQVIPMCQPAHVEDTERDCFNRRRLLCVFLRLICIQIQRFKTDTDREEETGREETGRV